MNKKEVTFRDPLVEQVIDQFVERSDVGFAKYKVTLDEERTKGIKDLGDYFDQLHLTQYNLRLFENHLIS